MRKFLLYSLFLGLILFTLEANTNTFKMTSDTVNLFKFLNRYNIKYEYDPLLRKVSIDNNKIEITSGFKFYRNGREVVKSRETSQNKQDGFYVSPDVLKDISKTLLNNKIDIIEAHNNINIFDKSQEHNALTLLKNKQTINENRNYKLDVIVIDLGHGGSDPGSIGNNLLEKNVVLETGLKLEQVLKKRFPKIEIIMTRTNDIFHSLQKRSEIANEAIGLDTDNPKNGLFISLHANASFSKSARGFEVFFLSAQEATEYARAVSMFEHSVNVRFNNIDEKKYDNYPKTDYYYMLIEQYQKESKYFAQLIVDEVYNIKSVHKRSIPVNNALFYVLKGSIMPSVLVELGFVTNKDDAKLISSKKFQDDVSQAIADALDKYINEFEKTKGFTK